MLVSAEKSTQPVTGCHLDLPETVLVVTFIGREIARTSKLVQ